MKSLMNVKILKNKYIYFLIIVVMITALSLQSCETQEYHTTTKHKYHIETDINHEQIDKPDFSSFKDVQKKKEAFINYILNAITAANNEICGERKQLDKLIKSYNNNNQLTSNEQDELNLYTNYYKIKDTSDTAEKLQILDSKIGTIPTSFILAQAILESGWGSSRFAKDYNNYFGLHCFKAGCGEKAKGAEVYLEVFNSATDSVLGYYYRLNTGSKFKEFRVVRNEINNKKTPPSKLLDTLEEYSELENGKYKARLQSVIDHNNLYQYDNFAQC